MSSKNPTYQELKAKLAEAEEITSALRNEEVDAVIGKNRLLLLRLKEVEETLRESEEQFRAIADYTYDWESWLSSDGHLMWINPAVENLTGYSAKECREMPDYPLPILLEDYREEFAKRLQEALKEQTSINDYEFSISHKNGAVRWMSISWQPIYSEKDQYIGQRTSIRDITDRKQAEEKLRESSNSRFLLKGPISV